MRTSLVFTFISDDHPGLIEDISKTVADHDGNWLESEMCQLAGKFAGIIRVSVPEARLAKLSHALQGLSSKGLKITLDKVSTLPTVSSVRFFALSIIGLDRPGILHEVTFALAKYSINISQMSTEMSNAPMTGESLFSANARIEVPESVDFQELQDQLDSVANDLAIDINFESID